MNPSSINKFKKIKEFPELVEYLANELDWPIRTDNFEDLMFDYSPAELGLDKKVASKFLEIRRLRPLDNKQPWGIFFIRFDQKRLPVVALRRLLSKLVIKRRAASHPSERASWHADDLLLISQTGDAGEKSLSFAHFSTNPEKTDLPILKVLGWDDDDTGLRIDHVIKTLREKLIWPEDSSDSEAWRAQWRAAFTEKNREVIQSSKDMAKELAKLALSIRTRLRQVLEIESDEGSFHRLMKVFKDNLISDLDPQSFSDMYAQTIAYGLLSARVINPSADSADAAYTQMPITSPFLRELMEEFLSAGGQSRGSGVDLDFDELGINDVVELLDRTNMEAVLRDFGDRNRQEDPVMHFFEGFLSEYDIKIKKERGVFYTPQPVVSYIVRSVDELLRTEFCLEDGLADTATWGEMVGRIEDLEIPEGTTPDQAFVQILDPATGTGTFPIEVIELIHNTMTAKWQAADYSKSQIEALWNEYVPKHLLPRLYGYELMMAPYAIAHMKIGLKLHTTGYDFKSKERARIYLTNALQPPQDSFGTLAFAIPALAREAEAVNAVKLDHQFTVVIGNPPYSGHSANSSRDKDNRLTFIGDLIEDYKKGCPELSKPAQAKWLQDDYVKFIRFAEYLLRKSTCRILGFITNHSYLDNNTFRGMRRHLCGTFHTQRILNLHGNFKRLQTKDLNAKDQNIFNIQQGVSIQLSFSKTMHKHCTEVFYADARGTRSSKYAMLLEKLPSKIEYIALNPREPLLLFIPRNDDFLDEYNRGIPISEIMSIGGDPAPGMISTHDQFAYAFSQHEIIHNVESLLKTHTEEEARELFRLCQQKQWNYSIAKEELSQTNWREACIAVHYRPFDLRYTINDSNVAVHTRKRVHRHMLGLKNLALCTNRQVTNSFQHVFCTRQMADYCMLSTAQKEGAYLFPLYILPNPDPMYSQEQPIPNFSPGFLKLISGALKLPSTELYDLPQEISPESIFYYMYAELHSPTYRMRYGDYLKTDFPRLHFPKNFQLFDSLARLGNELCLLHLLESEVFEEAKVKLHGKDLRVSKIGWTPDHGGTIWLDSKGTAKDVQAGTTGFSPVPKDVWDFCIGGYQVCAKWLKERGPKKARAGRVLTYRDIEQYQQIVVALSETIRIMAEIDEVIEGHGGWPGAFVSADAE